MRRPPSTPPQGNDMADSELTKMIQERLAERAANRDGAPAPEAESVESESATPEAVEQQVESAVEQQPEAKAPEASSEPAPVAEVSPLKQALAKVNIAADQYSEDEIQKQLVNVFAERDEQRRRMAELQAQVEALSQQQPVQQQVAEPVKPETNEQKLRRWQKVEIDQNLTKYCEFDDKTSKFLADPKYGIDGQKAAQQLNEAVAEQQRRSQLMVNDPVTAMQEAGLLEEIENKIESRIKAYHTQLAANLAEKQKQVQAYRYQQQEENEFQKFYTDHKNEFFRVSNDGNVMVGLDGKEIPTERGLLYSNKVREICNELGVDQPDLRIWKLAYKMLPPVEPAKNQEELAAEKKQQVEAKKNQFVEQARKKPDARKVQVSNAFVQPVETPVNRKMSFREMLERDPDNAEILGANYRGN